MHAPTRVFLYVLQLTIPLVNVTIESLGTELFGLFFLWVG